MPFDTSALRQAQGPITLNPEPETLNPKKFKPFKLMKADTAHIDSS